MGSRVILAAVASAMSSGVLGAYIGKMFRMPAAVPQPALMTLGGVKEVLAGISNLPIKAATGTAVVTAVLGTALYAKRARLRRVCSDYIMQLKERMGFELKETEAAKLTTANFYGESVRPNSAEQTMLRSKHQVLIGAVVSNEFVVYGSAIRIFDSLVVPTHVLTDAMDSSGIVWIKGSQGVVSLTVQEFSELDTDISHIKLTLNQFSKIGCPQATLQESLPPNGEFVSICGVKNKGTVGKLMHDLTTFGKVTYTGTTLPGYSGAPYMKGQAIVGIHCWGGVVNGGYSASYVKTLIQAAERMRFESSEDWLLKIFNSKKLNRSDVYFVPGSDEARIRYNGSYHIVDGDVFRKARGFDFLDGSYDDSESTQVEPESLRHSGESRSLRQPGVSENASRPGDLESLVDELLTQRLSVLTIRQLTDLRKSARQSSVSPQTTPGLLSQEKQK